MWILEPWFERNAPMIDGMVVLDDGSSDGSLEFLHSRAEVTILLSNPQGGAWRVFDNYNRMLRAASSLKPDWIIIIDADDLLDARFVEARDALLSDPSVSRYHFREISLWRSSQTYRVDHPEMYSRPRNTPPFLVRYSPKLRYCPPHMANPRAFIKSVLQNPRVLFNKVFVPKVGVLEGVPPGRHVELDLVHLHYHFASRDAAWKRHMIYALYEALQAGKTVGDISEVVEWATRRLDEEGLQLADVDPSWGALSLRSELGSGPAGG
jgi:glycosyltransferase involved in cell wall biosynthesis